MKRSTWMAIFGKGKKWKLRRRHLLQEFWGIEAQR
jgi:hypothetical protein